MAISKISTEYNSLFDKVETYYYDDVKDEVIVKNTHRVGDVLEQNKRAAAATLDRFVGKQRYHHVAEIPNGVIVKLKKEHNIDVFSQDPAEQRRLMRLLQDPEYRYLKTTTKRLWRPKGG